MNSPCQRCLPLLTGLAAGVLLWCIAAGAVGAQTPESTASPAAASTSAATATQVAPFTPRPTLTASTLLPAPNPDAEQWVAAQIAAGEIADLSTRFPAENDRILSATFLQNLLTRAPTNTLAARHGVRIGAAVISETLDLHNAEIPTEVWLIGCRFGSQVDLSESRWASNLDLSGSRFKSPVNLGSARIGGTFGLVQSVFESSAELGGLTSGSGLIANEVKFIDPNQRVNFALAHMGGSVFLRQALFAGPTYFTGARVDGDLSADQARFTNSRPGVTFDGLMVGRSLSLYQVEVSGPVDFVDIQVGRNLMASQARFMDATVGASFSSMKVGGYAFFRQATFAGRADFSRMEVGLDFEVAEAEFTNPDKEAAFNTMTVRGYASITKASFAGSVDFVYSSVALDFNADSVRFTNPSRGPNFSEMKVGGYAYFTDAIFAGPATFIRMSVGTDFAMYGARFEQPAEEISFSSMKVGGYASFSRAQFAGSADFGLSPAQGLQADEMHFPNPQGKAGFSDLNTPGYAFLINSVFTAPVQFIGTHIGGDFLANGTRFLNADKGISLVSMEVGGSIFMHDAVFEGPLDFHHGSVALNLEMDGVQVNSHQRANFGNTKVGGIASFTKAMFSGPVVFVGTDVSGQFILDGAHFNFDGPSSAVFDGMRVGDSVAMGGVTSAASLSMADVTFLDLNVEGMGDSPLVLPQLDLSRSVIKRQLSLTNLRMTLGWIAPSLQVLGPCLLHELAVEQQAVLEQANLQTLVLSHVTWPTDTQNVRLDGITYQNISAGAEPTGWRTLLDWANHASYSADVYTNLQQYYRRRGYPEQADAIFVAGQRRERAETLGGPSSVGWWWNLILDGFVVYGRRPGRAFVWSALVILFGAFLFRRRYMEPLVPEYAEQGYSAFWYSVDLFVPVLDLLTARRWTPRREYWLPRHYLRIHAILGWLLIPIGLAALSGLLK